MNRRIVCVLVSVALLAVGVVATARYSGPAPVQAEPAVERVYELEDLMSKDDTWGLASASAPLDRRVIAGVEVEEDAEDEYRTAIDSGFSPVGLRSFRQFDEVVRCLNIKGVEAKSSGFTEPTKHARVTAPESLHRRIEWFLKQLRTHASARVQLNIVALKEKPASFVVGAAAASLAGGTEVARTKMRNGEPWLVSDLQEQRVVFDVDRKPDKTRVTGTLYSGDQWRVLAIVLADGRIRVAAQHARGRDPATRAWQVQGGPIELPQLRWSVVPAVAVVENGGGLILDSGNEWFLIRARCDTKLGAAQSDDGEVEAFNASEFYPVAGIRVASIAAPTPNDAGMPPSPLLPQRGEWDLRHDLSLNRAAALSEYFVRDINPDYTLEPRRVYYAAGRLALRINRTLEETDDPAAVARHRAEADRQFAEQLAPRPGHVLRVKVIRIPEGATLAQSFATGNPSAVEVETLGSAKGATVMIDRTVPLETGQVLDLASLWLRNYVAEFLPHGVDRGIWSPQLATYVSGWQLRLSRHDSNRTQAKLAFCAEGGLKLIPGTGGLKGLDVERPEGVRATVGIDAIAADGVWQCAVQPLEQGQRLVLLIQGGRP